MNTIVPLPLIGTPVERSHMVRQGRSVAPTAVIAESRRRTSADDECFYSEVLNDSMSPRFEAGERLIVNMSLRPKVGDDVYMKLKSGVVAARRLVAFDGKELRLLQYNPEREDVLSIEAIEEIYPVVAWEPPLYDLDGSAVEKLN